MVRLQRNQHLHIGKKEDYRYRSKTFPCERHDNNDVKSDADRQNLIQTFALAQEKQIHPPIPTRVGLHVIHSLSYRGEEWLVVAGYDWDFDSAVTQTSWSQRTSDDVQL